MIRSLTRAWAPVPLKGQSSRITPRFASTSRAASFTGIGSVLVSITIVPRCAEAASSAATSARAWAEGSEVMTVSARRATSRGLLAATPPDRTCSARRRGTTSKPATRNPARMRFADIAEPMIPSPIIPTVCCFIASSFSVGPPANTLPFSLKKRRRSGGPGFEFAGRRGHRRHVYRLRRTRARGRYHRHQGAFDAGQLRRRHARRDARGGRASRVFVRKVLRRDRGAHPRHHGRHERPDPEKRRESRPDHDAGPRGRDPYHARLARRFLARYRQGGPLSFEPET